MVLTTLEEWTELPFCGYRNNSPGVLKGARHDAGRAATGQEEMVALATGPVGIVTRLCEFHQKPNVTHEDNSGKRLPSPRPSRKALRRAQRGSQAAVASRVRGPSSCKGAAQFCGYPVETAND
jgi:hypothetical protein